MSDFAKAQLLKYGWTEGKGLGKNENGMVEALKPKLKFDTTGVGHKDLNFEWWDSIYDKALKNIVLDKKSDEVSINVAKENAFNISSSVSGVENSKKKHKLHYGKFLKTSTLQDGNLTRDSTCAIIEDEVINNTIVKMTDEKLFKACGGRTAHKGARHGLTLNGKLARIAEQEKQLLVSSFLKSGEDSSLCNELKHRKKKKRKMNMESEDCTSVLIDENISDNDDCLIPPPPTQIKEDYKPSKRAYKKVKRKIHDLSHQLTKSCMIDDDASENKEHKLKKKKKCFKEIGEKLHKTKCKDKKEKSKRKRGQETIFDNADNIQIADVPMEPHIKKSKKKDVDFSESNSTIVQSDESSNCVQSIDYTESVKSKNKCKKDKIHRCCKDHKYDTKTEAQRLNNKIKIKKDKKIKRKEKKKLEKLSASLLAVSLDVNSAPKEISAELTEKIIGKKYKFPKKCKKNKSKSK